MKSMKLYSLGAALLAAVLPLNLHAESPAGQVDFGKFYPPGAGGEFVEVNITSSLISLAMKLVEKEEPDVARLLGGLQLVRVNVIGLDEANRTDMEKRVEKIRKELDSKGWERIVTAQKEGQDVGVYLKSKDKDTVQGVVVMVIDGNHQAVFVNVVGDIKPEQIALLGEKLHLDPLKKLGHEIEK
jgi:hypothetical protein